MVHLSTLVFASTLLLDSVFCSPLSAYFVNTTTASPTVISSGGASDSSCGGCKIVADGAHLLYWNPIIKTVVQTNDYGDDPSRTFATVSHAVSVTDSLPVVKATRTLIYSYYNPALFGNGTSATNPTEAISGFTAYVAQQSINSNPG